MPKYHDYVCDKVIPVLVLYVRQLLTSDGNDIAKKAANEALVKEIAAIILSGVHSAPGTSITLQQLFGIAATNEVEIKDKYVLAILNEIHTNFSPEDKEHLIRIFYEVAFSEQKLGLFKYIIALYQDKQDLLRPSVRGDFLRLYMREFLPINAIREEVIAIASEPDCTMARIIETFIQKYLFSNDSLLHSYFVAYGEKIGQDLHNIDAIVNSQAIYLVVFSYIFPVVADCVAANSALYPQYSGDMAGTRVAAIVAAVLSKEENAARILEIVNHTVVIPSGTQPESVARSLSQHSISPELQEQIRMLQIRIKSLLLLAKCCVFLESFKDAVDVRDGAIEHLLKRQLGRLDGMLNQYLAYFSQGNFDLTLLERDLHLQREIFDIFSGDGMSERMGETLNLLNEIIALIARIDNDPVLGLRGVYRDLWLIVKSVEQLNQVRQSLVASGILGRDMVRDKSAKQKWDELSQKLQGLKEEIKAKVEKLPKQLQRRFDYYIKNLGKRGQNDPGFFDSFSKELQILQGNISQCRSLIAAGNYGIDDAKKSLVFLRLLSEMFKGVLSQTILPIDEASMSALEIVLAKIFDLGVNGGRCDIDMAKDLSKCFFELLFLRQFLPQCSNSIARDGYVREAMNFFSKDQQHVDAAVKIPPVRVVVLYGLKGMGKTTIIAQIMQRIAQQEQVGYQLCLSFNGHNLAEQYLNYYDRFNLESQGASNEDKVRAFKEYLARHRFLLIYEDMPDDRASQELLPQSNCHIIITTHCARLWRDNVGRNTRVIKVSAATEKTAHKILTQVDKPKQARELNSTLGSMPKVLMAINTYMQSQRLSSKRTLLQIKDGSRDFMHFIVNHLAANIAEWQSLLHERIIHDQKIMLLLGFCTLLGNGDISWSLVENFFAKFGFSKGELLTAVNFLADRGFLSVKQKQDGTHEYIHSNELINFLLYKKALLSVDEQGLWNAQILNAKVFSVLIGEIREEFFRIDKGSFAVTKAKEILLEHAEFFIGFVNEMPVDVAGLVTGDFNYICLLRDIANGYTQTGRPQEATAKFNHAIKIAEQLAAKIPPTADIASNDFTINYLYAELMYFIGRQYFYNAGVNIVEADYYFKKALAECGRIKNKFGREIFLSKLAERSGMLELQLLQLESAVDSFCYVQSYGAYNESFFANFTFLLNAYQGLLSCEEKLIDKSRREIVLRDDFYNGIVCRHQLAKIYYQFSRLGSTELRLNHASNAYKYAWETLQRALEQPAEVHRIPAYYNTIATILIEIATIVKLANNCPVPRCDYTTLAEVLQFKLVDAVAEEVTFRHLLRLAKRCNTEALKREEKCKQVRRKRRIQVFTDFTVADAHFCLAKIYLLENNKEKALKHIKICLDKRTTLGHRDLEVARLLHGQIKRMRVDDFAVQTEESRAIPVSLRLRPVTATEVVDVMSPVRVVRVVEKPPVSHVARLVSFFGSGTAGGSSSRACILRSPIDVVASSFSSGSSTLFAYATGCRRESTVAPNVQQPGHSRWYHDQFNLANDSDFRYKVGDCLFAAIAHCINDGRDARVVRGQAVQRIREDRQLQEMITAGKDRKDEAIRMSSARGVVEDRIYTSWQEYVFCMGREQTWGTGIEVEALSRALQRPIVVFLQDDKEGGIKTHIYGKNLRVNKETAPIFLQYSAGEGHYSPLVIEGNFLEIWQQIQERYLPLDQNTEIAGRQV